MIFYSAIEIKKMKNKKKKSIIGIIFKAFIIFVITFLIGNFPPTFRRGHSSSPQKACYSNIRVIQGAVEMYNMDTSEMMKDLDFNFLLESKFLKEKPFPPEKECNYSNKGDLSEDGQIYCALHGGMVCEGDPEVVSKKERENQIKQLKETFKALFPYAIPAILYLLYALM